MINKSDIVNAFQSIYSTILSYIKKSLEKGLGLIIDSVIDNTISTSNYNPLAGSSYIKLPHELNYPRRGLLNIQNIDDNECFKWSIVWYLNPATYHPARITKTDQDFAKKHDFKDLISSKS